MHQSFSAVNILRYVTVLSLLASGLLASPLALSDEFDLVIEGGRVIDPQTGLDEIKNVGITQGTIATITSRQLAGRVAIDASGKVVSPGFIDLHVHGMSNIEQEYQLHDGVTTALEMESGMVMVKSWLQTRKDKALINFGAAASWGTARVMAMPRYQLQDKLNSVTNYDAIQPIMNEVLGSLYESVPVENYPAMFQYLDEEMQGGALGYAVPIGYFPGAQPQEDYRLYEYAAKLGIPIFTHVRKGGLIAVQQVINDAMLTGASLHVVHMNSMALKDAELGIEMVNRAYQKGFDISTEIYPYTAASTDLVSALFDEGWQDAFSISYKDLQWVATGERLTEESFNRYRKTGGTVIMHMMKPEWIKASLKTPRTIIASDGMPYAKLAHPRTAGTFSRVLGKYVREEKALSLHDAIAKITLLPAQRMESIAPAMRFKGRLQIGADADITIFDPTTVIDKATFENGLAFSDGIDYVIVNGTVVVSQGKTVPDVFPGKPILGKFTR